MNLLKPITMEFVRKLRGAKSHVDQILIIAWTFFRPSAITLVVLGIASVAVTVWSK